MRASLGRNGARKRRYGAVALVQVLLFVFGFSFVASAGAAKVHPFKETFGSVAQPTFTRPLSVVVDQSSGDVLVLDAGAQTVSRFKPDGEPDPFSVRGYKRDRRIVRTW